MSDLSARIGKMLFEGEGIAGTAAERDFPRMVELVLDRWPEASAEEIHRGFLIAIEIAELRDAEEAAGAAP
ncbi:hypothetical protein [Methylobacterium nonmethylotrophicum]|uniref:Uncharacterized protein n=1 Tax=Methylobacterium nonmethylotrophicum TaxID=1141884 RepID=A0A4Z0NG33_9HYPH|nr:hypothetical protein [Methylobacterium nonmethylotrophicum]TGD94906.1 hypothetical protein EU555_30495 [Methylobacterium nonmethylotrophicum]